MQNGNTVLVFKFSFFSMKTNFWNISQKLLFCNLENDFDIYAAVKKYEQIES